MTTRPFPSATFPKRERIRKRSEYLAVQEGGRKLSTASFLVFVRGTAPSLVESAPAADPVPARFGITVTKKIGDAVTRNRIKRLVREAVRRHKLWFPEGREVVFVAKRPAANLGYADLERELETLCTRYFAKS